MNWKRSIKINFAKSCCMVGGIALILSIGLGIMYIFQYGFSRVIPMMSMVGMSLLFLIPGLLIFYYDEKKQAKNHDGVV